MFVILTWCLKSSAYAWTEPKYTSLNLNVDRGVVTSLVTPATSKALDSVSMAVFCPGSAGNTALSLRGWRLGW